MTPGRLEELRQLEPAPVPGAFDLTVVVPTRNERDNIAPLLRRLERVCPELRLEVLFVDDSTDDTPRVIEEQMGRCSCAVSLIHRPGKDRSSGLGGAPGTSAPAAARRLIQDTAVEAIV